MQRPKTMTITPLIPVASLLKDIIFFIKSNVTRKLGIKKISLLPTLR
ncbi:MAG: hypothetical protein JW870_15145 [Candidatus Delongbacteria bacterium]|nr:hypothetical protein [Candidatus Delongbacteria bacterium]